MVRKYHNHKLQTNLWHRGEEPHNNNKTPGRQKSKVTSSRFPIKMIAKLEWTQSNAKQNIEQLQNPQNGSINQQRMLEKDGPLRALISYVILYISAFPYGVLAQAWYLIESIPDLCLLPVYNTHTTYYAIRLAIQHCQCNDK